MKKVIVGILIGIVVVLGGCAAMFTAGVSSVDKALNQVKEDTVKNDSKVQDLAKDMSWDVEKDQFTNKIVGTFENKSNEKIDYLQFDYKLIDKEGTVIESSFTNETDIMPKEKRKVEILCSKNNFDKYEITAKSSAF